jgi:hypothetical protein
LLCLDAGKLIDALLAQPDELVDAGERVAGNEVLDVALGAELQLLLDLDLDPQPLAIEAVLVALFLAEHGVVALVDVLVGAAPGVVDAHGVVGGDGTVEEGPARPAGVLRPELREGADVVPELQNVALLGGEIHLRLDLVERHDLSS